MIFSLDRNSSHRSISIGTTYPEDNAVECSISVDFSSNFAECSTRMIEESSRFGRIREAENNSLHGSDSDMIDMDDKEKEKTKKSEKPFDRFLVLYQSDGISSLLLLLPSSWPRTRSDIYSMNEVYHQGVGQIAID